MAFPRSGYISRRVHKPRSKGEWLLYASIFGCASALAMQAWQQQTRGPRWYVPDDSVVLTLDLTSPPRELSTPSLFSPQQRPSHYDTLRVLDFASRDKSVRGLMARVGPGGEWNMAQAQEIRQAIERFAKAGKYAHAFADTFGEFSDSNTTYYLASAFDKIYLQPCGDLNLLGYKVNSPFLRSLFDRLGVLPQFVQRKEYKNAPNMFTETHFTPAHKESVTSILSGMYETVKDGIARGRGQTAEQVEQLMSEGPLTATEARDRGLVDELAYENELFDILKRTPPKEQQAGGHSLPNTPHSASLSGPSSTALRPVAALPQSTAVPTAAAGRELTLAEQERNAEKVLAESLATFQRFSQTSLQRFDSYAETVLPWLDKANNVGAMYGHQKVALIYGLGEVTSRLPARSFGQAPAGVFHSSTLVKAIHKAALDPSVKVIVLRIDSPGGSYVAADTIHAALCDAKLKGKKLVVSMGSMAASGGYFAAAPADTIFANDATLTGSIGVFGGKFALRRFLEDKATLKFDQLQVGGGDTAGMYSMVDPWTPPQLAKINTLMDRIYADFVGKVAVGRRLNFEHAESLARGRVWTGLEARQNGLVDQIGGLWDAIQYAKRLIDPTLSSSIKVEQIPKNKTFLTLLAEAYRATSAEWDDKPLFSSTGGARAVVAATVEEAVKEGVGMAEARVMQELMMFVSGGRSMGGLGVDVHAGGALHELGIMSPQGKLLL